MISLHVPNLDCIYLPTYIYAFNEHNIIIMDNYIDIEYCGG